MPTTIHPDKGKQYAEPYEESYEDIDLDHLPYSHSTVDLTYLTHKGTRKTVRAVNMREPIDRMRESYGFGEDEPWYIFHGEGDTTYGYHTEDRVLKSIDTDRPNVTLARGDDILGAKKVQYPEMAVIDGARQEGVEATVYYRSPRSDGIVSMDVEIDRDSDHDVEIRAIRKSDGQKLEIWPKYHRKIKTRWPNQYLGRVCRIEYPRGHRFTVEVEGLSDERAERDGLIESFEEKLSGRRGPFRYADVTVNVEHDGRLERD